VNDQGVHFINAMIEILKIHCLIKRTNSTTYYPKGNAQVKSTNKAIRLLLITIINENNE
jgi:hypothetical protein